MAARCKIAADHHIAFQLCSTVTGTVETTHSLKMAESEDQKLAATYTRKRKLPAAANSIDWSIAFPHVKTTLYEDGGVGVVLKPALDRITVCSGLFVRNLLLQITTTDDSDNNKQVSVEALRKTVETNEQCQFLQGVLDHLEDDDDISSSTAAGSSSLLTSGIRRCQPKITKKRPTKSVQHSSKKPARKKVVSADVQEAMRVVEDTAALKQAAPPIIACQQQATTQEIVADEEDYD